MSERLKQLELVGCGAMAQVFRGALLGERGTRRQVAIKRLRPELAADPAAVELFVNEARISVRLDHPNVVHALELTRDEQGYALVCEWLDCTSLAELSGRGARLAPQALLQVGRGVAAALDYLHHLRGDDGRPLGLVHRDVTPANVFVTAGGQVKLGDFGVAWCAEDRPTVTTTAGTPAFAAPEQLAGHPGPHSDLYGLGATLRAVAGELPADLAALLDRACAPDPAARYASAAELRAALEAQGDRAGATAGTEVLAALYAQAGGGAPRVAPQLDDAVQAILGGAIAPQAHEREDTAGSAVAPRRRSRPAALALAAAIALTAGLSLWLGLGAPAAPEAAPAATPAPATARASPASLPLPPPPPPMLTAPPATPPAGIAARKAPRATAARPLVPVQINAIPWARVSLDGRVLGNTPLGRVELPEGRHELLFEHPPQALRRQVQIEVEGPRAQTFLVDLRSGTVQRRVRER